MIRAAIGENGGGAGRGRGAFTITELLVVIGIIAILVGIAVPAATAVLGSAERSLAENRLRAGVAQARALALEQGPGRDAALVVLFEPGSGIRLVPAVEVGTLVDSEATPDGGNPPSTALGRRVQVRRSVFVPTARAAASGMPAGWGVRGYAPPGSMREITLGQSVASAWYDSPLFGEDNAGSLIKDEGHWVFPETAFYDRSRAVKVASNRATPRQSFMIRFEGRTGRLRTGAGTALFVDPRPGEQDRSEDANPGGVGGDFWKRVDKAEDLGRWASRVLLDPNPDPGNGPFGGGAAIGNSDDAERIRLIGSASHDTVLVRGVSRLALYRERELARGIGARGLNQQTGTIYRAFDPAEGRIQIDTGLFGGARLDDVRANINRWIAGDTAGGDARVGGSGERLGDGELVFDPDNAAGDPVDDPRAVLFSVSAYTGELGEVER